MQAIDFEWGLVIYKGGRLRVMLRESDIRQSSAVGESQCCSNLVTVKSLLPYRVYTRKTKPYTTFYKQMGLFYFHRLYSKTILLPHLHSQGKKQRHSKKNGTKKLVNLDNSFELAWKISDTLHLTRGNHYGSQLQLMYDGWNMWKAYHDVPLR